jgi:AbrB family looped-hinge helix DNA binding protein
LLWGVQVRITSRGQVTIPVEIRERLGLLPNCEVEFEVDGSAVRIRKARGRKAGSRGRSLVQRMAGKATSGMSTDEILALTRGGD